MRNRSLSGTLTGRKLALLSYLLVTGQPCERGILADLLWCDLPEQEARKNLRNLVYNLRQHLPDYLVVTKTTIAISQEQRHWTDAQVFTSYMASEFPPVDADILHEVLALYQGEFLTGFYVQDAPHFEAWVTAQRTVLHDQTLQGLHWLGEHYLACQDYAAGLAATRQALTLAPWCETSHRQQMLLLAATGQQQEAFAQYERCRQILAEECEADPLPATTLLYQQIKNMAMAAPDPQQLATWQRTLDSSPIQVNWEAIPQQPRLIGREDELTTLTHWLYTEPTPLIAVVGLPGQGKTALLAELVIRVVEAGEAQASAASARQCANATPANAQFEQILWYSMAGALILPPDRGLATATCAAGKRYAGCCP
ncbi:MAG: BTAD domain-containing putative transcriptional regulator [Caldilineaceae bacterium]